MRNSCFSMTDPMHHDFIAADDAALLQQFMRRNFAPMRLFRMSRHERNRIAEVLVEYYRIHIPGFPMLKSLEVLQQLFDWLLVCVMGLNELWPVLDRCSIGVDRRCWKCIEHLCNDLSIKRLSKEDVWCWQNEWLARVRICTCVRAYIINVSSTKYKYLKIWWLAKIVVTLRC